MNKVTYIKIISLHCVVQWVYSHQDVVCKFTQLEVDIDIHFHFISLLVCGPYREGIVYLRSTSRYPGYLPTHLGNVLFVDFWFPSHHSLPCKKNHNHQHYLYRIPNKLTNTWRYTMKSSQSFNNLLVFTKQHTIICLLVLTQ